MTALYPRLFTLLFASTISLMAVHAQDKPAAPDSEKPERRASSGDFRASEQQLNTTDCAKMPNRSQIMDCTNAHTVRRVIKLHNATNQNDANEILVAIRVIFDPGIKIFLSASQDMIVVATYPEEAARIEEMVRALDLPHPTYRVTFTMTEVEGDKPVGVQHYTLLAAEGQRTTMKQGSKVPVVTGSYKENGAGTQQQFTYLDIGNNIDTTITPVGRGLQMKLKVEQSSVVNESEIAGVREPVVRQTVFDGVPFVLPGKPTVIGRIDVPGSTRHVDIDALVEPL